MTKIWGELTWGEMTMGRDDSHSKLVYTSSATRDLIGLEIVDVRQYLPPK